MKNLRPVGLNYTQPTLIISIQIWTNYETHFQKVGVRTPIPQRAPPVDLPTFLAFGQKGFLSTKYLRVCLFCLVSIFSETPCLTMAKFCTQMYRPCANNLLGFMSKGVVVTKKRHF